MEQSNDSEAFNKDYQEFLECIKSNDSPGIRNKLELINQHEESFLNGYNKRKKEGVYYTDDEISNFMIHEALIILISEKLEKIKDINIKIIKIQDINQLKKPVIDDIIEFLKKLRICDPACGAGVFLYNYIQSVSELIKQLKSNIDIENLKKELLENVYGYDINEHAIKLCILKLFSSIFNKDSNDHEQILTNLISNIKVKNSLMDSIIDKYDLILSNPPYGNIIKKEEREFLKKENNYFYNDIYCAFILKALNWSKCLIGLLIPKSFLLRQGYVELRNVLISRADLYKIFDIGSNIFKKATNEVQILLYKRKEATNKKSIEIFDYPDLWINSYNTNAIDELKMCVNRDCPLCDRSKKLHVFTFEEKCPYCKKDLVKLNRIRIKLNKLNFQIIDKIEHLANLNYLNPKNFPRMIRGEEEKGLKLVKQKLQKNLSNSCFFINAKDDFKYFYLHPLKSFNLEEIDSTSLKGSLYEYYLGPKLLIKHNNIIPEAVFTSQSTCFTSSIYSLLHDDSIELKFLCALLNSAIIQFYCIFGINNQKDTTINLNQYMIRHLPIKDCEKSDKSEISNKVDQLLVLYKASQGEINKNIKKATKDLDDIIFNLYNLTEFEKELILQQLKEQISYFKEIYS